MNRREILKTGAVLPFALLPFQDKIIKEISGKQPIYPEKFSDSKGIKIGMGFTFFPYKSEELRKHYLGWLEKNEELWGFVDADECWVKYNGPGKEMEKYHVWEMYLGKVWKEKQNKLTFGDKVRFHLYDSEYVGFITGIRHKLDYDIEYGIEVNNIQYPFYAWVPEGKFSIEKV